MPEVSTLLISCLWLNSILVLVIAMISLDFVGPKVMVAAGAGTAVASEYGVPAVVVLLSAVILLPVFRLICGTVVTSSVLRDTQIMELSVRPIALILLAHRATPKDSSTSVVSTCLLYLVVFPVSRWILSRVLMIDLITT